VKVIIFACEEPIRQMALNAGLSPDIVVERVKQQEQYSYGLNFMNDQVVDLMECGIIDPVKVTRCALENAVSVASTIITTSHAIVNQPD